MPSRLSAPFSGEPVAPEVAGAGRNSSIVSTQNQQHAASSFSWNGNRPEGLADGTAQRHNAFSWRQTWMSAMGCDRICSMHLRCNCVWGWALDRVVHHLQRHAEGSALLVAVKLDMSLRLKHRQVSSRIRADQHRRSRIRASDPGIRSHMVHVGCAKHPSPRHLAFVVFQFVHRHRSVHRSRKDRRLQAAS